MSFEYNGVVYRDLEPQVRYDAEQVQLLKQADVTINQNLQTINTEINGKLAKPTTPTAESAVTMLADGTVGTKPLSEIGGGGGGKLYRHHIRGNLVTSDGQDARASIGVDIIKTSATPMNEAEFKTYVSTETVASISGMEAHGTVAIYSVPDINEYGVYGAVFNPRNTEAAKCIFTSFTFNRFTDTVTEL